MLNALLILNALWDFVSGILVWCGYGLHLNMFGKRVPRRTQKILAVKIMTYAVPRFMAGMEEGYDMPAALTYFLEGIFWIFEEQWTVAFLSFLLGIALVGRYSEWYSKRRDSFLV